jgi:hypothetical protein
MSNSQGDAINRQASQAGRQASERAEMDRINRENAQEAARRANG